jgi:hypothetical protein
MSSSKSLILIESHGFRALIAAIAWLIATMHRIGRGLRNLVSSGAQPGKEMAGQNRLDWLFVPEQACARWQQVNWFDTVGGRDGPSVRLTSIWPVTVSLSPPHCLAGVPAGQATPADRPNWRRT